MNTQKIKGLYRSCKHFIRNIWVFRKTLCYHRAWDYSGSLYALEDALSDIKNLGFPCTANREKDIKQIGVCIELIKRIREDTYDIDKFDYSMKFNDSDVMGYSSCNVVATPKFDFPTNTKHIHSMKQRKNDMEMLFGILNKRLLGWWD